MKKFIAAIVLLFSMSAFASCPPFQPYGCHPIYGGKMMCGCGQ